MSSVITVIIVLFSRILCSTAHPHNSTEADHDDVQAHEQDGDHQSGEISDQCAIKTIKGDTCVFPFTYKGAEYQTCTSTNHNRPWCSLTSNYGRDKKWGSCIVKTTAGGLCKFPFTYNGVRYKECTEQDKGMRWCALTADLRTDSDMWGMCALDTHSGCAPEAKKSKCIEFTHEGTGYGGPCYFPYLYKGISYSSCIVDDSHYSWCANTASYSMNHRWGYCTPDELVLYTHQGGRCVFPFKYAGRMFYGCTTDYSASGTAWCSTTADMADGSEEWGYCNLDETCGSLPEGQEICSVTTSGGNSDGAPCVFPFTYELETYSECTSFMQNGQTVYQWCGTTADYDTDGLWGVCGDIDCKSSRDKETCKGLTYGGNAGGARCVFPFMYKNKEYKQCTAVNNNGVPWCSTTADYDIDKKWGSCAELDCEVEELAMEKEPSCAEYTQHGNGAGAQCVFPFTYRGREYTECTTVNHKGKRWCATTSSYDRNKKWGNCIGCPEALDLPQCPVRTRGGSNAGAPCVFPFLYKGKAYTKCTTKKHDQPWCATETHYYARKQWSNCIIETTDGRDCVFPFIYNNKVYKECTSEYSSQAWCATTRRLSSFDTGFWGNCSLYPSPPCESVPTIKIEITPTDGEVTPTQPNDASTPTRIPGEPDVTPTSTQIPGEFMTSTLPAGGGDFFTATTPREGETPETEIPGGLESSRACGDGFQLFQGTMSFGGSFIPRASSMRGCTDYCLGEPACLAVDFNTENEECYAHSNPNNDQTPPFLLRRNPNVPLIMQCVKT